MKNLITLMLFLGIVSPVFASLDFTPPACGCDNSRVGEFALIKTAEGVECVMYVCVSKKCLDQGKPVNGTIGSWIATDPNNCGASLEQIKLEN